MQTTTYTFIIDQSLVTYQYYISTRGRFWPKCFGSQRAKIPNIQVTMLTIYCKNLNPSLDLYLYTAVGLSMRRIITACQLHHLHATERLKLRTFCRERELLESGDSMCTVSVLPQCLKPKNESKIFNLY